MPTPYQKLEKINKKIRNYYYNRQKSKKIPLIVQNSKNALNNSKLNLSERQKNKSKNYFSLEKYGKSDTASLSFNNNIMKLNTSNKKCMSETAYHKK